MHAYPSLQDTCLCMLWKSLQFLFTKTNLFQQDDDDDDDVPVHEPSSSMETWCVKVNVKVKVKDSRNLGVFAWYHWICPTASHSVQNADIYGIYL